MSNPLVTFIGWSIVPNLATGFVQSLYYGITIRAGDPKPTPGTPLYAKHYRRIRISLIILYLFYTIYEASQMIQRRGDFYQILGVAHDLDDKGIKSRFRRLAALHHPDKVAAAGRQPVSEDYFVQLKLAQDTLLKPVHRFAYDRFGPDILQWQHCSTVRDYISTGFQVHAPSYVASGVVMIILGATGSLQWGRFWRYYLTAALVVLDMYTVTRPYTPRFLTQVINPFLTTFTSHPPLLQFQVLVLARNLLFTTFIGLSQLAPFFQGQDNSLPPNEVAPSQLTRLEQQAQVQEAEGSRLLSLSLSPFFDDRATMAEMKDRIREWLVQNTVRADPLVRESIQESVRRRREQEQTSSLADQ